MSKTTGTYTTDKGNTMGGIFGGKPKAPKIEPIKKPPTRDQAAVAAEEERKKRLKGRRGMTSTILSDGSGEKTTILGG
jgi:hypothetical protein